MNAIADIAFSAVLGLSALVAALSAARARKSARDYILFAAVLFAALSLADVCAAAFPVSAMPALAASVTPIVVAPASAALAFALCIHLAGPPHAAFTAILLSLSVAAGIVAAATGALAIAFAPLFAGACAMLAFSARAWRNGQRPVLHGIVAALALIAGASAYLTGGTPGRTALALFAAAGLLGVSLAAGSGARVKAEPRKAAPLTVGGKRRTSIRG